MRLACFRQVGGVMFFSGLPRVAIAMSVFFLTILCVVFLKAVSLSKFTGSYVPVR
jgi:hypothetical protein